MEVPGRGRADLAGGCGWKRARADPRGLGASAEAWNRSTSAGGPLVCWETTLRAEPAAGGSPASRFAVTDSKPPKQPPTNSAIGDPGMGGPDAGTHAGADSSGGVFDPKSRLVVAMSGGVDSSAAAWILREAGHGLVGLFMRNGVKVSAADAGKKSCCSVNDARDARMVAAALEIPFQAVDLGEEFRDVIRYFLDSYRDGKTPNPCAVCNRDLKFRRLMDFADEVGAAGVATGHYARLDRDPSGRVRVRRGVDRRKDQSYQLFSVAEADLARTRLPLGDLEKPAVRELAEQAGLRTHAKPDSQEICFVPGNDYRKLLEQHGVPLRPGRIVDTSGAHLADHPGIAGFTIGQRRGHGLGGSPEPRYVVELDAESATVVVGSKRECLFESATLDAPNWIGVDPPESGELRIAVQIRYHHGAAPATLDLTGDRPCVRFDEPQSAVTPGQGAAFYLGDRLIGGSWIASAKRVPATAPTG